MPQITQLRPWGFAGSVYGDFTGKANTLAPVVVVAGGAADEAKGAGRRKKKLGRVGEKWVPFTDGLELARLRAENLVALRTPQERAGEPDAEAALPEPEAAKGAPAPAPVDVRPFARLVALEPIEVSAPRKDDAAAREKAERKRIALEAAAKVEAERIIADTTRRKRNATLILLLAA